ncbi:MAG: hypothetical protein J6K13_09845 [Clostridia bacterium]|nr:hypothetical protein [Clostridia bacterium]
MSRPVGPKEIELFRLLYAKSKSYSQVARLTGYAMPTVRKYILALQAKEKAASTAPQE